MSNVVKQIRGQVRQVVQEVLPHLLGSAIILAMENKLREEMRARLDVIDERQKDIQAYIIRQDAMRSAVTGK